MTLSETRPLKAAGSLLACLAAGFSIGAWAAPDNLPGAPAEPGPRTRFLGFTALPPPGQGWHLAEQYFNHVLYVMSPTNSGRHTVILFVHSKPMDPKPGTAIEVLESILKASDASAALTDSRYANVTSKIAPVTIGGAQCARMDFSAEDRGVPWASGAVYLMQGFHAVCLHPRSPRMLVDIGHSQRFEAGRTPVLLDEEVAAFLANLKFNDDAAEWFSIGPLLGSFAYDKAIFFPEGRDQRREALFMEALKEGGCSSAEVVTPSPEAVQKLAVEYDVAWLLSGSTKRADAELGCVLGKVGRWNEALEAFSAESGRQPASARLFGLMGVAANALGRYEASTEHFRQASDLEPEYFDSRPRQRHIHEASQAGSRP